MAGRRRERGGGPLSHPVTELRRFLAGRWRLARTLSTGDGTWIGTFTGQAAFTPYAGELYYAEDGELTTAGHRSRAGRELRYVAFDGPRCAVLFHGAGSAEPGSPFHDLDLATGHWEVLHPCAADRYRGEFAVTGEDTWTQHWTVTGPAKSYRSATTLTREP